MDKRTLHDFAPRLGSSMFEVVTYLEFLSGRKSSEKLREALAEMYTDAYEDEYYMGVGEPDKYGGLDPWEVDIAEAEKHLHFLIDCLRDEDVRPATRYMEYLLQEP